MGSLAEKVFFTGKSTERNLFKYIKQFIQSLGPVEINVTKSQISFRNKRQFAWVWLPMPWDTKRPKNSVILSFSLKEKVSDPQIVQVVEPYPGRFMHHIVITKETDLTGDVKSWLEAAYGFGGKQIKSDKGKMV